MSLRPLAICLCLLFGIAPATAQESGLKVVTTILPLHSLAMQVIGDLGMPDLLLEPATSPHAFTLKPSQTGKLEEADRVYWIGPALETALVPVLETLGREEAAYPLIADERLNRWAYRDHHTLAHGQDDEAHDGHDHGTGAADPHLWLDLENAQKIMLRMSGELSRLDTDNSFHYGANWSGARGRLDELREEAAARMAALTPKPYLVFHDAYQYFERDYGLAPAGVVTVSPERGPSAQHLMELRGVIESKEIVCLFVEPQFPRALAETVVEGTGVPLVEIDPLGVNLEPGPDAYRQLYLGLVRSFETCFQD